jgi:hypothetical protein
MNVYSTAVFFHVLGGIGIFIALAVEGLGLFKLTSPSNIDQKREWARMLSAILPRIGAPSVGLALVSGLYLTEEAWREAPWVAPSLGALILIAIVGVALNMRPMRALRKSLNGATENTPIGVIPLKRLGISLQTRFGLALGILFLMTTKPGLQASIAVLAVAVVLLLISGRIFGSIFRGLSKKRS